jgi:hypothetical protein
MSANRFVLGMLLLNFGCGNTEPPKPKPADNVIQVQDLGRYLPWGIQKFAVYKDFETSYSNESGDTKMYHLSRQQDQQKIIIKGNGPDELTEVRFEGPTDGPEPYEGLRRLISTAKHLFPAPDQAFEHIWTWAKSIDRYQWPAKLEYSGVECEIVHGGKVYLYLRPVNKELVNAN